jgi:hypothetical protein
MPTGALERLGQKMTELQIRSLGMEHHLDEIPKMSAVRLLTVEYESPSPELMEAITKIPHLQKLSLVPRGRRSGSQNAPVLSPKILALLQAHPTLKDVYADGHSCNTLTNSRHSRYSPYVHFHSNILVTSMRP